MINPEQADLQLMRQKAADGTITMEELKNALAIIRQNRSSAQHKKAGKKAAAKINTDKLLDELGGL